MRESLKRAIRKYDKKHFKVLSTKVPIETAEEFHRLCWAAGMRVNRALMKYVTECVNKKRIIRIDV